MGITEARGRLMERNGEDYICPNCTAKKNQVVRPATSMLSMSTEIGKHNIVVATSISVPGFSAAASSEAADKANTKGADSIPPVSPAVTGLPASTSVTEEKGIEDMGIKGRIEKATNPTGKKKIKIFQPVGPFERINCFEYLLDILV